MHFQQRRSLHATLKNIEVARHPPGGQPPAQLVESDATLKARFNFSVKIFLAGEAK